MKDTSEVTIDVGSVKSREELHSLLAKTLGFPDYYGNNWDAFDECIRDFPPAGPLRVTGIQKLSHSMPREAELLKQCLADFQSELPDRRQVHAS
jgi:RNAse (barnase) inhibitor barstar